MAISIPNRKSVTKLLNFSQKINSLRFTINLNELIFTPGYLVSIILNLKTRIFKILKKKIHFQSINLFHIDPEIAVLVHVYFIKRMYVSKFQFFLLHIFISKKPN